MNPGDFTAQILDGLDRLAAVLRAEGWAAAETAELTATQAAILTFLGRRGSARLQEVAAHLAVSVPTASASVDALVRKALVARRKSVEDARAVALALTPDGRVTLERLGKEPSRLRTAVAAFPPGEQADLFLHLMKLIRTLQTSGAIPVQRVCVTCRHFRPFAHPESDAPHHCALVNASFGNRDLRLDCGDHGQADADTQIAIWAAFDKTDSLSAQASVTLQRSSDV